MNIDQSALNYQNITSLKTQKKQEKHYQFKVSAIVSTYKSEKFISGCLEDLVSQTLYKQGQLEIIVIDSASPENEYLIIQKFQAEYPYIIYQKTSERETLYTAWNRAIKLASGCYITNANTDDRHRFDALEIMANYLDNNSDIALVYADQLITTIANETFATTQAERRWNWPNYSYEQMKLGCCVGSQPMWRKSLHEEYGYFRENFYCSGDYEFWLRLGKNGENMTLIPKILGLYYFNPQGIEHSLPDRAKQECDFICKEYNIPFIYVAKKSTSERKFTDLQYQGCLMTSEEKEYLAVMNQISEGLFPVIVVDGIFFQLHNTGIARVWKSLLKEWKHSGFSKHIVVLDREQTAPRIPGIKYRSIQSYDYSQTAKDSQMIQSVCDEVRANLFISTYYTTPISTPSVFMAHDMIPEVLNADYPVWKEEKRYGILHARAYITISENTTRDLVQFFPSVSLDCVTVANCGVEKSFEIATCEEINQLKIKYSISKPYFLLVGERVGLDGCKNALYFFQAFSQLANRNDFAIVCVGGNPKLEPEMTNLVRDTSIYMLSLSDYELKAAYSGAVALVYPSLYEGFGLPILEAMACGCPVITCRNSSLPEVGGEAVIYVSECNIDELVTALSKVQHPDTRSLLVSAGLEQAKKFSWSKMAEKVAEVLMQTAQNIQKQNIPVVPSLWEDFRSLQAKLQNLQSQLQPGSNGQVPHHGQLQQALALIDAMETSKFWKLRTSWFKLKQSLGLPVDSFESQVNCSQPTNIQLEQAYATIEAMRSSKFWKLRTSWFRFKRSVGILTNE